ncbi:hypothetical protein [Chryseobacterium arthrosphaerae]|uniref:hypothetical protein n=1 Tax=Chryseobacterium arthrosphaerae TaxID=651561 RepID=UPI00241CF4A3|nr:hypothetical protein [Chryseobacterium arthrosphaerae]
MEINNTKLTAIILPPGNINFNEQYRALTIQEGQKFTVGIKEYEEEKKKILDQIYLLTKEKEKIESDLKIESNRLLDEATKRHNEGGKWLKMEKHNGKEVTHVQVSLDENIRIASEKADKIKKQKDAELKKQQDALDALEKTCKSIVWAWHLAKSRSSKPNGRNEDLDAGPKQPDMTLGKHINGGGFAWIEPFWEKGKPTGSPKNGIYIQTAIVNPKVNIAEWYGFDSAGLPRKITAPIQSGSKVQLHIYTESMYGQNIGVELKVNGEILKANTYSRNSKPDNSPGAKYEVTESENLFQTEVDIYDYSDSNSIQPPPGAITGILIDAMGNDKDGKTENIENVQKAVLTLYIGPIWCIGKNGVINITPTVVFKDKRFDLNQFPLYILSNASPNITIPESGNKPVFVDNIETSFEAFHHCRYDIIKGSYTKLDDRENNEPLEITIFDSKTDAGKNELFMPVIAGNKQARRNVKIILDSNTTECTYAGDKIKDHTSKVFDLSQIQQAIVVEKSTRIDEQLIFSENEFKIGNINFGKEEEGHGDTNDDNEINASHTTGKGSVKGPIGMSSSSKSTIFKDERKIGRYPNSDKEIVLDVGFEYGNGSPASLLKYIWPTRKTALQNYPVLLHTCAYPQKTLNIGVYPDIKWILQFSYDCDPEKFNEMRGEAYDKYLVRTEKLADKYKPEKIEERISKIDGDLANAKANLQAAKKKEDKTRARKLITKLEQKKAKQQAQSRKYNKESTKSKQQYRKDRPDLFNFKENISSGLSDLVLSLNVEYDRPGEAVEISASYQRYVELVKQLIDIKNTVELILDGKKKSKKKLDKKYKEINEKAASENMAKLGDALKGRPLLSVDIIPPSLAILGSWYAENPKEKNIDQVGIVGEIQVMAEPLIGAEVTLDFLALVQKAHPVARGIITLIDMGAAIGVAPEITLDLVASGQLEIEGKLRYNSASKTSNLNQQSLSKDSEDDSPLTVKGVFSLELTAGIKYKTKRQSFLFGSITLYAEATLSVKTGFTLSGAIKADDKGFYLDPLFTFHGITVKGSLEMGYIAENYDGGEYSSGKTSAEFELVLMHEYEGSFENSKGEKIQFYLT